MFMTTTITTRTTAKADATLILPVSISDSIAAVTSVQFADTTNITALREVMFRVNIYMMLATKLVRIKGSVTRAKVWNLLAPRVSDASSIASSICPMAATDIRKPKGIVRTINRSMMISAVPEMISGGLLKAMA